MANKYVNFNAPSPYASQQADLERRQRLAELMQQQAMQPIETNNTSITPTQGLAKVLKSYLSAKQLDKINKEQRRFDINQESESAKVERAGNLLAESVYSGRKPLTIQETTPDENGLALIRGPNDLVRLGSDKYGRAALGEDPALLEAYKKAITPKPSNVAGIDVMGLVPDVRKMVSDAQREDRDLDQSTLMTLAQKNIQDKAAADIEKDKLDRSNKLTDIQDQREERKNAAAERAAERKLEREIALDGKPQTEAQSKSEGFAHRLINADKYISNPKLVEAATSLRQETKGNVPLIGNFLISSDKQSYDQAVLSFVNAKLRQESGAVIGDSEFVKAERQYFPRPGDSKELIQQKTSERKIAINDMIKSAGRNYTPLPEEFIEISGPGPAYDALPIGAFYMYKGTKKIKGSK